MKIIKVKKIVAGFSVIIAALTLYSCSNKELIIGAFLEDQSYWFHDVSQKNRELPIEFGSAMDKDFNHDLSLKINGKDVIDVTVVDLGGGRTGIYCAFSEEQKPQTVINGSSITTTYNGGTTLAATISQTSVMPIIKWKYKMENKKSSYGFEVKVLDIITDKK